MVSSWSRVPVFLHKQNMACSTQRSRSHAVPSPRADLWGWGPCLAWGWDGRQSQGVCERGSLVLVTWGHS